MQIRNPRTGIYDYDLTEFSAEQVEKIAVNLRKEQSLWWQSGLEMRIEQLQLFAAEVVKAKPELVKAIEEDTGRWSESELEVDALVQTITRWCNDAPKLLDVVPARPASIPFLEIEQQYYPYPVVGVVSPWNFPLLLSFVDAIPALLAGCALLIKPSEVTSRFVETLSVVLAKVPQLQKVLALVTGGGETGQAVTNNVDILCFTGSVATGRRVGEQCAKLFIPAFLELGGKDAAIVCADADLDIASSAICWGSMVNAGQSCMSIERVYVDSKVAEEFKQLLVAKVSNLKHNYPAIKTGQVGPVISDKQVAVIEQQFQDAKQKNARFLCGGEVVNLGGGVYCQPTVVDNITPDMLIGVEETFAPVLVIETFSSEQEAVNLANATKYGLSGAVFSQDIEKAHNIAKQLIVGGISINDTALTGFVHEAEKQSFGLSGLGGSRMGDESIRRFIRKKALLTNTGVRSPWWF
ncbi:Acyl-CoA reductase [Colwellia chukchiensis]|uniref:Acyl-CoA reductase n=1 Tax=Colwellia chukchiensis TaxID=641665 RepID=A0A1H7NKY9_9GAMM|nr:aldehyde dehydrogenase family protein [Colwellia chukchiensis]SEL24163.1 Acyl-CoA reductase [Colwellia chukchiensis]